MISAVNKEANELWIEKMIRDPNCSLSKLIKEKSVTYPEDNLRPEALTDLRNLFLATRLKQYEQLTTDEQLVFWAQGFFHNEQFNPLFEKALLAKHKNNTQYEWIWNIVFAAIKLETQISFKTSKFSFFCNHYDKSAANVGKLLQTYALIENSTIEELVVKEREKVLSFINPVISIAQTYIESEADISKAWEFCFDCLSHPLLLTVCLKKESVACDGESIIVAFQRLDQFVQKYSNMFPLIAEDFKNVVTTAAKSFVTSTSVIANKIRHLADIRTVLTELWKSDPRVAQMYWQIRHDRSINEYDIFNFFVEEMFGDSSSMKRKSAMDEFLTKLNTVETAHADSLLDFAILTSYDRPLIAWATKSPFSEVCAFAKSAPAFQEELYAVAAKKDEWLNKSWAEASIIMNETRSSVLVLKYLDGPKGKDVPFDIWIARVIAGDKLPF